MESQETINYGFLSFDECDNHLIGRIWTTIDDNDELVAIFNGEDKSSIIDKAKKWAFHNYYDIEW